MNGIYLLVLTIMTQTIIGACIPKEALANFKLTPSPSLQNYSEEHCRICENVWVSKGICVDSSDYISQVDEILKLGNYEFSLGFLHSISSSGKPLKPYMISRMIQNQAKNFMKQTAANMSHQSPFGAISSAINLPDIHLNPNDVLQDISSNPADLLQLLSIAKNTDFEHLIKNEISELNPNNHSNPSGSNNSSPHDDRNHHSSHNNPICDIAKTTVYKSYLCILSSGEGSAYATFDSDNAIERLAVSDSDARYIYKSCSDHILHKCEERKDKSMKFDGLMENIFNNHCPDRIQDSEHVCKEFASCKITYDHSKCLSIIKNQILHFFKRVNERVISENKANDKVNDIAAAVPSLLSSLPINIPNLGNSIPSIAIIKGAVDTQVGGYINGLPLSFVDTIVNSPSAPDINLTDIISTIESGLGNLSGNSLNTLTDAISNSPVGSLLGNIPNIDVSSVEQSLGNFANDITHTLSGILSSDDNSNDSIQVSGISNSFSGLPASVQTAFNSLSDSQKNALNNVLGNIDPTQIESQITDVLNSNAGSLSSNASIDTIAQLLEGFPTELASLAADLNGP